MPASLHTANDALRHVLVTLGDRAAHALEDAPPGFAGFEAGHGVRPPLEVLRHLRHLTRFAASLWTGRELVAAVPEDWDAEVAGWRADLRALDAVLRAHPEPTGDVPAAKVLQGPLLDAMTHVGQLALLRRLAGAPVGRRAYFRVDMAELTPADAGQ